MVAPGVVFAEVDGETVLLDAQSGTYFGLDEVGTRAWTLMTAGSSLGDVHAAILSEYDVAPEVLWADLAKLVGEMVTSGLVTVAAQK